MRRLVLLVVTLLLGALPLRAWAEKGHYIVNEAATFGTPAQLPPFFHRNYPRLIYLSTDPDRWRGGGEALEAVNPPDHFFDYEYAVGLNLTANRYDFLHELESSGRLEKYQISNASVGFLPWRIAELCDLLTTQWRLWRSTSDRNLRSYIEQNIIEVAGILGHYVGDASNPHHTTYNYNGWVEVNPERYPYDCDTHDRFERDFVTRTMRSPMIYPALHPLTPRGTDYFRTALAFVGESNGLVETLYRIDRDHGLEGDGTAEAREFTIARLAAGASLLRDLWVSCYLNSAPKKQ